MTTIISNFQGYTGPVLRYQPPITAGLLAWHFIGETAERTRKNHGGTDGVIVGTPEYFASHARMRAQANYLLTDVGETDAMTVIAVSRAPDPGSSNGTIGVIAGNAILNTSGFALTYRDVSGTLRLEARRAYTNGGAVSSIVLNAMTVTPGEWRCLGADFPASGAVREFNLTSGAFAESAAMSSPIRGAKIRAGSATSTWSGQTDLAFLAVYNRVLPAAEKATVYASVQQAMAGVGITV